MEEKIKKNIKYEILPEDFKIFDLCFKIIIIGDSGVGKTCLTLQGTKNIFQDTNSTVGFEFSNFNLKINDKYINLSIWDTCGQEIYRSLISGFYRNCSLAMIVYSITDIKSFNNIDSWIKDLKIQSSPDVKIILIGNKCDLNENRQVSKEKGEMYCKDNNLNLFFETSAKTGFNSKNVFIEAAKILYFEYLKVEEKKNNSKNDRKDNNKNNNIKDMNSNVKINIPVAKKLKREVIQDDVIPNECIC